jgi:alanyl-tRNA synthetase
MATTKLYWQDSHLTRFTARVVESWVEQQHRVLVLDQTAFYPEGGGQPCDVGRIDGAVVMNVTSDAAGRILHYLDDNNEFHVGDTVNGSIDWARRREMLQQHTGQHILSQAFFQLFGAETKGFRIADQVTQIDLALELPPDEIEHAMERAEELANQVIFDNRPLRIHEVTPEEAAKMPLRKESFISDCIRIIEIADFDWSPCGGTHAKQTGEVGLLGIRGWERVKQMMRVDFVCGIRALRDYRLNNRIADTLARQFTVGRDETVSSVTRLVEDHKALQKRSRLLAEAVAQVEAQEILATVAVSNDLRVVSRVFLGRELDEVKMLAHKLVAQPGVVALLAIQQGSNVKLIFARSANAKSDMNALLRAACEELGGRGGGKPDFAQGGGNRAELLEQVLAKAKEKVLA